MNGEGTISKTKQPVAKSSFVNRVKSWASLIPSYVILGLWSLLTVFSILWVIASSFKTNRELFTAVWSLPSALNFDNYIKAWTTVKMGQYFSNSVIVVLTSVFIVLFLSAPVSYILTRVKFKGSGMLLLIFTAGIGIPVQLLYIPLFILLTQIGVINSLWGLGLLYISLSIPFTVFILSGFFATLPRELEEAATIDGCTDFQVYWKVLLPLASPGLITAAIFNFIFLWNEYQIALVFINDPDLRTLPLGLYALSNAMQYTGDWVGLMAGVVIIMVPTIILYTILSEKMIAGITMGSVK
ncbi:MAG: carbohydrate ABC transporter permease [Anaerolineales bacterium]|nr:carbohydrate ABC transporter permease [Anaerolineales bacterium]